MADLNELVLAFDELFDKKKKSFYDEVFRPAIKEALLEPEKSMKNFGKSFLVVFPQGIPEDHLGDTSKMMLECAQMLADEGFMFHLTPENIQITQTFVPLSERLRATDVPWVERLTAERFYLRLWFTR
jgi:hypothetical protein